MEGKPGASRRSVVITPEAMVATSQPLAVQTGIDVMRRGGNAVDAAIAANAVLGVVEPMSCGLGGDLFVLGWDAASARLYGLNGSGRAPGALTRDLFAARGLDEIPSRGALSWSVPGCVDGWFALHARYGRLPMAGLLAPAITYAQAGFPVSPRIAQAWANAVDLLSEDPAAARTFLPDGSAPHAGQPVANPDLAQCLEAIALEGRDAFYTGRIAEQIDAASQRLGGFLTLSDLATHRSAWIQPMRAPYRGTELWELPPNTQGLAALEMMRILDGFDLAGMGHNSTDALHHLVEAKKLAYEDRAVFCSDEGFGAAHLEGILSEERIAAQRARIRADQALTARDGCLGHGDTVYVTAVDEERNAVSLIQSLYMPFGSGIVPGPVGFALQNRGSLFSLDPRHPNRLDPGKRPFHTIIPALLTIEGQPVFSFGVMGGDQQPQGQAQILCNLIDFRMDPQSAGDALRFRHDGSSTPTGRPMCGTGRLSLEPGIPEAVADGLRARGHDVAYRDAEFGGYQGIWIDPQTGMLHGGSEPRKDGCAAGY